MSTDTSNEIYSLFLPVVNVLQDHALDESFKFNIDFQNNDLYTLQELTRSAAIINYINASRDGQRIPGTKESRLNKIFDDFVQIPDPLGVFIGNFEQFFVMYIHSLYGKNNFQVYMKEFEKSPVSYPINCFVDSICIFMQYNTTELRSYIYNILTMFYYYTGQNFYEMISPTITRKPRPNDIAGNNRGAGGVVDENKNSNRNNKRENEAKTREQKLGVLNRRNLNINKPYMERNTVGMQPDILVGSSFRSCVLTTNSYGDQSAGILVSGPLTKPINVVSDNSMFDTNAMPYPNCNASGNSKDGKIFKISEHLRRSCNYETNTITKDNSSTTFASSDTYEKSRRETNIQTNFSNIWSCANRRQLVSLSIINSVMNVCIQKITYSMIESREKRQQQEQQTGSSKNDDNEHKMDSVFTCVPPQQHSTSASDRYTSTVFSEMIGNAKKYIKLKRPTIEISFVHEVGKTQLRAGGITGTKIDNLKFSS